VRLIDKTGKSLGVVDLKKALQIARERDLDLIQITSKVQPPVCKIEDLGKYIYRLEKKEKGQKKGGELKEIRLRYNISPHDLEIKARLAKKFLKEGNQVRVRMQLRGRENIFGDLAKEKIGSFLKILEEEISLRIIQELKKKRGGFSMVIIKR